MTTPDGLTAEEREVLRGLGGASLFEYDGARARDRAADPEHVTADYDRRILLVTVDRAVRALARHVRDTGCEGLRDLLDRMALCLSESVQPPFFPGGTNEAFREYLSLPDNGRVNEWFARRNIAALAARAASPEASDD